MRLFYDSQLVGEICDTYFSDNTFYGNFFCHLTEEDPNPLARDILNFIKFCEDWNERQKMAGSNASPDDFDQFGELTQGGRWKVESDTGVSAIDDWPVFFRGGEISWASFFH